MEIVCGLSELPFAQIGITQAAQRGGVVRVAVEDLLKLLDGLLPVIPGVQMDISQDSAAVGGAQRRHYVSPGGDVGGSGNGIVLGLPTSNILAEHFIKLNRTHAEGLLNGVFYRHFLVVNEIEVDRSVTQ